MKTIDQMSVADLRAWRPQKAEIGIVREMVLRIVAACSPEKVIVFGSYARGDAIEESDIDFLVIQETDLPRPKRALPLYAALRYYPLSKDIVVYTPAEVASYSELPESFVRTALREGLVLYDKNQSR